MSANKNVMTWDERCDATVVLGTRRAKAFRLFMERTRKLAAKADPRTGGNEALCINWGNDAALQIWRNAWPRWKCLADRYDRRFSALWAGRSTDASLI